MAVHDGQQVGYSAFRASLWTGTAASWINLRPLGSSVTYGYAVHSGRQGGAASFSGDHAMLWSGSASSYVDLHPAGASKSYVYGLDEDQQAGYVFLAGSGNQHASVWSGTAASWIDLNPTGSSASIALAVDDGKQGGSAIVGSIQRASLWSGTAASWTDLNPVGSSSSNIRGMQGGQQVGWVRMGAERASLWVGTAASWVNLNPTGASSSIASGVHAGQQVGYATIGGVQRAGLWSGTPASWTDLHALLPAGFTRSEGRGIWHDGTTVYVVGFGTNGTTGRDEALMWVSCTLVGITQQPVSAALLPGSTASFSIAASGAPTSFQWRHDGVNLVDGPRITGSGTDTLTINPVQASDEGSYDCVASSTCNAVTSTAATLSCDPILIGQPPEQSILSAGLQFSVEAPANAPYSYRWRQNGQNLFNLTGLFSGVTTPTLTIQSVDPSLAGSYDCVLTDACGWTASNICVVHCPADFDSNGFVNGDDFDAFVFEFEWGTESADFDHNGFTNGDDFDAFVIRFEAGC